jgi:hypothetical protein
MSSVAVEDWVKVNGRLVRFGRTGRGTSTGGGGGGTTIPSPVPYPTAAGGDFATGKMATYPIKTWESIDPNFRTRTGLPNVGSILQAVSSRCYVELPEGFEGELVDFGVGNGTNYSCFAPNIMGIWGKGPDSAIIRMKTMSSTKASTVPPQTDGDANGDGTSNPLSLMRLGPMNSSVSAAVHNYGWTLAGTDQPDGPNGEPHNYSGYTDYMGDGSTTTFMRFLGIPGDWNSPPGETFQLAALRTKVGGSLFRFVEVDGFNEAGRRVGGGVGQNGSMNVTYEDCNIHDSYVSAGPIYSGAGGPNGTMCTNAIVRRCKIWHNANHVYPNPGGKAFPALNFEGIQGSVYIDQPDIILDLPQQIQSPHVHIGNTQVDVPDFTINEPEWHTEAGYPTSTNGAFMVRMPKTYAGVANKQVTPPTIIKNGVTLKPVYRAPGAGWPSGVNPATQFIIIQ